MDATITYVRKIPIWKMTLGFSSLLVGILGLITLNYLTFVLLLFGAMMLKTEGSELNLEAKTYREITSILNLKFGSWKPLGHLEYISVFNTTEDITVRALTAETTNSFPVLILNIFYETNKKMTVYKTKDIKDAFDVASHIADALMIDLLDATKPGNFKWVDKNALREQGDLVYLDS
ncbi:MAG: hypothetical protein WA775_02455 [Psychroserpens sp.]|uniref:hypothetical protein n=1 Tax=Psychroserpens sp. TaxID=2020870 RepID=UPI003CBD0851